MKAYFIRKKSTEYPYNMITCSYPYRQWCELCEYFESEGVEYEAWKEDLGCAW